MASSRFKHSSKNMSRRLGFDTSLTGAGNKQSKPNMKAGTRQNSISTNTVASVPSIKPPAPSEAHQKVPSPSSEDGTGGQVGAGVEDDEGEEVDSDSQCFICAEPITFWSVGVCGHRTCHVCAIRLRTFYKKNECTFCKTPLPSLLFSRSPTTPFPSEHHITPSPPAVIAAALANADKLPKEQRWDVGLILPGKLDLTAFPYVDEKLNVVFEDEDVMEQSLLILRFNCPAPDCAHMGVDWSSLERHTLRVHGGVLCNLCRSQLSRFSHEQVLYPPHLLALHDPSRLARGQRPPRPRGAEEEEIVRMFEPPHPVCEFCHQGFFGPDELFQHMRKTHEECFVCRQLGERDVYYQHYAKLEQHFNQEHFPCKQPACLEQKFVVFPSELDLKAHMVKEHGEQMSSRDRAQTRQIALDYPSYPERRNGGRNEQSQGGRSQAAGFSRGPQSQQISQPPLMTAAQEAQLRRQVQKDKQEESRRRKAFSTSLTDGARPQGEASGSGAREDYPPTASGFATPRENVDDATAARHAALLSRVSMLVSDSQIKLSSFRSAIRQFKTNESGAKDMIDTVFHVLDRDVEATTSVVREIGNLLGSDGEGDKQKSVLEALNGFRVEQQEHFPSLGGPTGQGSNWAGIASGKILNAKRTTLPTRRGGSTVWDRVEAAAASHPVNRPARTGPVPGLNGRIVPGAGAPIPSAFPSLGSGVSSTSTSSSTTHSTPWASGGSGSKSKSPTALTGPIIRSVNYPTTATSSSSSSLSRSNKPLNNSAFPSLPGSSTKSTSAAERAALLNKPTPREESIKRITGQNAPPPPVNNGWGRVINGVGNLELGGDNVIDPVDGNAATSGGIGAAGTGGGGGKKKGKGKQILFSVSARP
ncbi:hypothetical protein BCR39DRAFT_511754 [Naematelia encephala]|uniref:RING-type E3 ubiquitin transferase n=1 Tax=Naematelia encephala TaxID=71784 RepID=A0A1Y2BLT0_9TREE|nr:hypothetical protein BCR39DRAFT_511754 [Naematelia encephala]